MDLHRRPPRQRSVLVTGTSSGIGRASALLLARSGFTVYAGVRKVEDGASLHAEGGERIHPIHLDVTDGDSIAAAADRLNTELGDDGLDGLVNNAGAGMSAPMEYVSREAVVALFEVNVFGQLAVTQAMLPMIRRARGRILHIGSMGTHVPIPFGGVLRATKCALAAFNDSLRLELRPFGVHVCLIEPTFIASPAVDKTLGDPEATLRALPGDGPARYGSMLRAFTRRAHDQEKKGSPPEVVARTVLLAMTARRPRRRYRSGKDARLLSALPTLLPEGLLDRMILRMLGQPPRFASSVEPAPSDRM